MKHRIHHIFAVLAAALIFTACTHNNGNIGPLFGTWRVTQILCDGTAVAGYEGNMFFKFQSSVFMLEVTDDSHGAASAYGTWRDAGDNRIEVSFPDEGYTPHSLSHMQRSGNVLSHGKISGSTFNFTMVATDGHQYTFCMKKW